MGLNVLGRRVDTLGTNCKNNSNYVRRFLGASINKTEIVRIETNFICLFSRVGRVRYSPARFDRRFVASTVQVGPNITVLLTKR